jgi:diguanylate cyclase (GGDEF)-like protein/PAS domain S-box-containing protein
MNSIIKKYEHMKMILDNILEMVFFVSVKKDGSFCYEDVNKAAIDQLRFPKNFIGKTIEEVVGAHNAKNIIYHYQEAIRQKQPVTYEDQFEISANTYRWYESTVSPLFNKKGDCEYIIAVTRDITDRKQKENELELIFHHAADAVCTFDQYGNFVKVNPSFTKLFGWTEEELLNDSTISILPNGYEEEFNDVLRLIQKGESVNNLESKRMTKSGKIIHTLSSYSPIMENGQMIGGVAVYKDISKLKEVEKQLRESEQRFKQIADYSTDLITVVTSKGIILYASPSHEKILGVQPEFLKNKSFMAFVHHDDMVHIQKTLKDIVQTKTTQSMEFRRYSKNKETVWLEALGTPILNESGQVHQIVFMSRDISERKKEVKKLKRLAYHDSLTNLPNRRLFDKQLSKAMKATRRYKKLLAVFVLDCDGFKLVNDTYGHYAGDKVIQQFAQRLKSNLREGDMVSRMGGDEFQVLLTNIKTKEDALKVADRMIKAMEVPFDIGSTQLKLTTSIGIAFYKGENKHKNSLIKEADSALYKAKRKGKNTYCIYNPYKKESRGND